MPDLKKAYNEFIQDIEKNIKNPEDKEYIKKRVMELLNACVGKIEEVVNYKEEEFTEMVKKQQELEDKMEKMEKIINNIEKDIYSDEGFDFEIVCPYCNHEFIVDYDDNKSEIQCPECENIIELDWSDNYDEDKGNNCLGNCSHCSGCDSDNEDDIEEDDM